jgi:SOS-response transcriptional repressor LexA
MVSLMATPNIPRYGDTKFEVLAAIVDHWKTHTFGPTVEEVREAVGLTVRSSVQWHINDLLAAGYLEHIPKKHRSMRPTATGKKLVAVLREAETIYGKT